MTITTIVVEVNMSMITFIMVARKMMGRKGRSRSRMTMRAMSTLMKTRRMLMNPMMVTVVVVAITPQVKRR